MNTDERDAITEYDEWERRLIMEEVEKEDGRTMQQIELDVGNVTRPAYLLILKLLNSRQAGSSPLRSKP